MLTGGQKANTRQIVAGTGSWPALLAAGKMALLLYRPSGQGWQGGSLYRRSCRYLLRCSVNPASLNIDRHPQTPLLRWRELSGFVHELKVRPGSPNTTAMPGDPLSLFGDQPDGEAMSPGCLWHWPSAPAARWQAPASCYRIRWPGISIPGALASEADLSPWWRRRRNHPDAASCFGTHPDTRFGKKRGGWPG